MQALSSRWTYSLHGLLALIRPVAAAVFQALMVSSNCTPGSAHSQAASATWRRIDRAPTVAATEPSVRAVSSQSAPSTAACMKSSLSRTELLAFWYWMEWVSAPSRPMSKPEAARARALRSSRALHQMKSTMSGWSASRITILAARRVLPPDLMVPAEASAPRMKLTGPEAVPPPRRGSVPARMDDRLTPDPDPPLKMRASVEYHSRIDSMESSTDRMKQADACWGTPATPMLNHTGELKAARWVIRSWASSSRKASRSARSAK